MKKMKVSISLILGSLTAKFEIEYSSFLRVKLEIILSTAFAIKFKVVLSTPLNLILRILSWLL